MCSRPTVVIASVILTAAIALNGCKIDVDLTSQPKVVAPGEPVTFDVQVTNRSTCPVGRVVSLLFPFVPRNYFIGHIQDPGCRQVLTEAADAFCTGRSYQFPDAEAGCRIEEGELICEIDGNIPPLPAEGPVAVPATSGENAVTCETREGSVVCRIPESIYVDLLNAAEAQSEESAAPFECEQDPSGIVRCFVMALDPGETKSDRVTLAPEGEGAYRNWVLSFAELDGGVCGPAAPRPNLPCERVFSPCAVGGACLPGICVGGTTAGYGCNPANPSHCPGGSCTACGASDPNQVQAALACTTTVATLPLGAPAMSWWAMLTGIGLLFGAGGLSFHRARRGR
jgi:hypothetical protein